MILVVKVVSNAENEKIKKMLLSTIVVVEALVYTYAYIGVDEKYRYGAEWSDEVIFTSYDIVNEFNIGDTLYRIKDLTALTTENCPLVYNIPSMSTFLHLINTEQVTNCEQLGYSHNKTKINDYGGTILSDAVYGIKYVLSKDDLSAEIYNHIGTAENGIKLYEYKNNLPIGIEFENEVEDIPEELGVFESQNYLYTNLFNKQENMIEIIKDNEIKVESKENNRVKYTIDTAGKNVLYLYCELSSMIDNITVNGKEIRIPITNDEENTLYPTQYNNGILDLGVFDNQTIELEFDMLEDSKLKDMQLATLDIDKYNQIFTEKNQNIQVEVEADKIKITGNSEKETNLFIPINYDKGWKSNSDTETSRVYNNFIGVKLQEGENNIELQFRPFLYKESVMATIVTIALMVGMYFVRKKFDIRNAKWLVNILWLLGIIIYVVCLYKFYIDAIIKTFIQ